MTYYTCILCRTQGYDTPWVGDFNACEWVGGCPQCDMSQGIMPLGEVDSADLTDARRVIDSGNVDRLDPVETPSQRPRPYTPDDENQRHAWGHDTGALPGTGAWVEIRVGGELVVVPDHEDGEE